MAAVAEPVVEPDGVPILTGVFMVTGEDVPCEFGVATP